MDSQTSLTIAQVVTETVKNVAILGAVVTPVVYGVGEMLKKIKIKNKQVIPGWIIGVLAGPIGVAVAFLIQGFHFTGIGILAGIMAGFTASHAYSVLKSATAETK